MQNNGFKLKQILLAAALGAAFAAPASAQVTINGLVDNYVGKLQRSGERSTTGVNSGGLTTSWIGFKGSEDLGNGLKANFLLTSFLQTDTGVQGRFTGDTLFSRDATVGLSGGFGAISFGRELAPQFLPTILFNPFGDSYAFSPLLLQMNVPHSGSILNTGWTNTVAGDTGWSNSIRYTTPSFGGLTANLHYQFGERAGDTGKNNIGANVLYFGGPLSLTAFYQKVEINNPIDVPLNNVQPAFGTAFPSGLTAAEQKAWMIGGSYDLKFVKLFATYGQTKHEIDLKDKTASVGATVPLGNGKVLASFAQTRRSGATTIGDDEKRNTASVGYDYELSKRTDLYAIYMNDKITDLNRGNSFGAGIRHRF
jgi:predicted porin